MSIANPLTASSVIQRTFISKSEEISKEKPLKPDLGVYAKGVVAISKLGLERQQRETQIEASRSSEGILLMKWLELAQPLAEITQGIS